MIDKLKFYTNIGYKILKRDVVNNKDYVDEYDKIAITYDCWLNEMSRYTDKIIDFDYINPKNKIKILDFACGSGYISRSILSKNIDCEITAVDFSTEMLNIFKNLCEGKVDIVHSDGIEFLKNCNEKYDVIFFGWALSYFNHKELFALFKKVVKRNGKLCIITNTKGTLLKIEDVFLRVMRKNQKNISKPMDIKFNLPNDKNKLMDWLKEFDFKKVRIDEDEVKFYFDNPNELLEWLNKTGACAGTFKIFKDYEKIKEDLIYEIKKEKYINGKYEINHKFAYGIFEFWAGE